MTPHASVRSAETSSAIGTVDTVETVADVESAVAAGISAVAPLAELGRLGRARLLRAISRSLEERRDDLIAQCRRETWLGVPRLQQELSRARYQFDHFADVLEDGGYLEATIDHRGETPAGPRPDLRRMLVPLGPVGVFGASNFPFAFSVAGGDTASALAAGCPVVSKVHEAHPVTSMLSQQAIGAGARLVGITADLVSLVHGRPAGLGIVRHPAIRAIGFTGSLPVGRLLADAAAARPDPIPFYGELGALNVVVVAPGAARARGAEIGRGLAGSFTLGLGQYCTKPGLVLVPAGADGHALRTALIDAVRTVPGGVMLSPHIAEAFGTGSSALGRRSGVTVLAVSQTPAVEGPLDRRGAPVLLEVDPAQLDGELLDECFGPVMMLAAYTDQEHLRSVLERTGPALTGTVHADPDDSALSRAAVATLAGKVGRIIWNGYPTGLAVAWSTHHGGPYPASTSVLHSSVGATAIRRWLRPLCFQDAPTDLLPDELRDDPTSGALPRRVDGRLTP